MQEWAARWALGGHPGWYGLYLFARLVVSCFAGRAWRWKGRETRFGFHRGAIESRFCCLSQKSFRAQGFGFEFGLANFGAFVFFCPVQLLAWGVWGRQAGLPAVTSRPIWWDKKMGLCPGAHFKVSSHIFHFFPS